MFLDFLNFLTLYKEQNIHGTYEILENMKK